MEEEYSNVTEDEMDDFYQMEFHRIPKAFQFGKLQSKIFKIILTVLGIADFLLLAIIPWTATEKGSGFRNIHTGYEYKITVYSMPMFIVIVIISLIIVFLFVWMFIAQRMDKKAYRVASDNFARYKMDRQIMKRRNHRRQQEIYDSLS